MSSVLGWVYAHVSAKDLLTAKMKSCNFHLTLAPMLDALEYGQINIMIRLY